MIANISRQIMQAVQQQIGEQLQAISDGTLTSKQGWLLFARQLK